LYLASRSQEVTETGHTEMAERAKTRELDLKLITTGYPEYRLHPRWHDWFMTNIEDCEDRINEDFKPLGVFYSLVYWTEKFSPSFNKFFRQSEKINLYLLGEFF
jgi:spermidine synthase